MWFYYNLTSFCGYLLYTIIVDTEKYLFFTLSYIINFVQTAQVFPKLWILNCFFDFYFFNMDPSKQNTCFTTSLNHV